MKVTGNRWSLGDKILKLGVIRVKRKSGSLGNKFEIRVPKNKPSL